MTAVKDDRLIRGLAAFIGTHSCVLGLLMLFLPRFMLRTFGFPADEPLFFPTQGGIFLFTLGIIYLSAVADPALAKLILLSKALAVLFLLTHAAILAAPPIIWGMLAGDGTMFACLAAALYRQHRHSRNLGRG